MKPFPLIEIEGPLMERGQQYGRQAVDRIEKSIELYSARLAEEGVSRAGLCDEARRFIPTIENYNPDYVVEMRGIAQGAGVDLESILLVNARTEIMYGRQKPPAGATDHQDGCTTAVALAQATRDGHVLQGQNWDWKVECLETTIILSLHRDDGPDFLSLVEAGGLARHGLNSMGIGVGANYLHTDQDFGRSGIPLSLIRRRILDSELYYDALTAVFWPPRAFSNNMMVTTVEGESVCLETTPEEVFWVWPQDGLMAHANHFQSLAAKSKYKDLQAASSPDTIYRDRRVDAVLRPRLGDITVDDFKTAFFDDFATPRSVCRPPVFSGKQDNMTMSVATIIMDLTDRIMWVCPAPHENKEFTEYRMQG